ncbi:MAG TPA: hypothetical protein VIL66_04905 [Bacillota bacterium]
MVIVNPIELAQEIKTSYLRYLGTSFYFSDPQLRTAFKDVLLSNRLFKGLFLEGTPVYKRGRTPKAVSEEIIGSSPDEGFLRAIKGERPLYQHQEEAIKKVSNSFFAIGTKFSNDLINETPVYNLLVRMIQIPSKEGRFEFA